MVGWLDKYNVRLSDNEPLVRFETFLSDKMQLWKTGLPEEGRFFTTTPKKLVQMY